MDGGLPSYDEYPHPVYGVIGFVGEAFMYGAAGGSAFHFVRGLRSSPSGGRLAGAVSAARANAPRLAGKFGAYCAVFSAFESAVSLARRREDTWSSAVAAAATCGLHGMRRGGALAAARCALLGATGLVVLTGIDRAIMVSQSRSNALLRQKRIDRPLAISPSRTAPGDRATGPHCG
ncbi:mitochondrial import inner membrane translocase subunit TIM17-3-like [Phragmites australis]|uniref:mitochondrial import inner membrane translocase subunit TIM17-3-like n=1 Tax=Phragmites australis TaxID=29695 RepID=UPI002D764DEB|nr:mitochondrial import inner membrane translocase subunit TIM17-3-like [Phragmites australis]